MPDIRHRVEMSAPLAKVYEAVATTDGISEWWTRDGVRGESSAGSEIRAGSQIREGSQIRFFFGGPQPAAVMKITQASPAGHVGWDCVAGADEWIGTTLSFDLTPKDDETVVLFTHADWREASEFMAHCSARWAYFLLSLKSYVETGKGTPFPSDLKF